MRFRLVWQNFCFTFAEVKHQKHLFMGEFPIGFLYLLLGVIAAAVVVALIVFGWRQYKLYRLQSSRKDYSYHYHNRRG